MRCYRPLYLVIILIFLLPFVSAGNIESLEINTDIEGEYAYNNYLVNVVNLGDSCMDSLNINIPLESKIYFVKDEYGDLDYGANDQSLTINFVKCIEDERTILLKTRSKQVDKINGDNYRYIFDFYPIDKINKFQHVLKLSVSERNVYGVEPSVEPFIHGEKLIFSWSDYNISGKKIFIVKFKRENLHSKFYFILGFIALVGCLIYLIKYFRKSKEKKTIEKKLEVLNEKEKSIVLEILNHEGINQSILKNKLDLTKSNISKIITKLQFRGIIIKKSEGKINKLYLGDKLKKP